MAMAPCLPASAASPARPAPKARSSIANTPSARRIAARALVCSPTERNTSCTSAADVVVVRALNKYGPDADFSLLLQRGVYLRHRPLHHQLHRPFVKP